MKYNLKHGMRRTTFYKRYYLIKARCNRPNNIGYSIYGGRGIKCEWTSFLEFKEDMYESYLAHVQEHGENNTTIDRIDTNGNYCKTNCKWATRQEQSNNRRSNVYVTLTGETHNLMQWSKILGISNKTVHTRIVRGWSPVEALTTPIKKI